MWKIPLDLFSNLQKTTRFSLLKSITLANSSVHRRRNGTALASGISNSDTGPNVADSHAKKTHTEGSTEL